MLMIFYFPSQWLYPRKCQLEEVVSYIIKYNFHDWIHTSPYDLNDDKNEVLYDHFQQASSLFVLFHLVSMFIVISYHAFSLSLQRHCFISKKNSQLYHQGMTEFWFLLEILITSWANCCQRLSLQLDLLINLSILSFLYGRLALSHFKQRQSFFYSQHLLNYLSLKECEHSS